jgi:hypothetical protein
MLSLWRMVYILELLWLQIKWQMQSCRSSTFDPARLLDGGDSSYTKTFKSSHVECTTRAINKLWSPVRAMPAANLTCCCKAGLRQCGCSTKLGCGKAPPPLNGAAARQLLQDSSSTKLGCCKAPPPLNGAAANELLH